MGAKEEAIKYHDLEIASLSKEYSAAIASGYGLKALQINAKIKEQERKREVLESNLICEGHLFKPSGKWKYQVLLDYRFVCNEHMKDPMGHYISPNDATLKALANATANGISGVILSEPGEYALVCIEPPFGFPVLVQGTTTLWRVGQ